MAKDDYFVVVYRILSYLYDCFRGGEKPDIDFFGPEALKINNGYWTNVMESLSNEGYVTGVTTVPRMGAAPGIKLINLKITQRGIEYLEDNSKMAKAKELETIPGL